MCKHLCAGLWFLPPAHSRWVHNHKSPLLCMPANMFCKASKQSTMPKRKYFITYMKHSWKATHLSMLRKCVSSTSSKCATQSRKVLFIMSLMRVIKLEKGKCDRRSILQLTHHELKMWTTQNMFIFIPKLGLQWVNTAWLPQHQILFYDKLPTVITIQ